MSLRLIASRAAIGAQRVEYAVAQNPARVAQAMGRAVEATGLSRYGSNCSGERPIRKNPMMIRQKCGARTTRSWLVVVPKRVKPERILVQVPG
jgi:hypothetical protein